MELVEPSRARPVRARPSPATASVRCPFCHDAVAADETDCRSCAALHHADCAWELGACASCGDRSLLHRGPPRREPIWPEVLLMMALGLGPPLVLLGPLALLALLAAVLVVVAAGRNG